MLSAPQRAQARSACGRAASGNKTTECSPARRRGHAPNEVPACWDRAGVATSMPCAAASSATLPNQAFSAGLILVREDERHLHAMLEQRRRQRTPTSL